MAGYMGPLIGELSCICCLFMVSPL